MQCRNTIEQVWDKQRPPLPPPPPPPPPPLDDSHAPFILIRPKKSGYGQTDRGPTDLRTNGPTDQRTYGPTDLRTNGWTNPFIEMRGRI